MATEEDLNWLLAIVLTPGHKLAKKGWGLHFSFLYFFNLLLSSTFSTFGFLNYTKYISLIESYTSQKQLSWTVYNSGHVKGSFKLKPFYTNWNLKHTFCLYYVVSFPRVSKTVNNIRQQQQTCICQTYALRWRPCCHFSVKFAHRSERNKFDMQ